MDPRSNNANKMPIEKCIMWTCPNKSKSAIIFYSNRPGSVFWEWPIMLYKLIRNAAFAAYQPIGNKFESKFYGKITSPRNISSTLKYINCVGIVRLPDSQSISLHLINQTFVIVHSIYYYTIIDMPLVKYKQQTFSLVFQNGSNSSFEDALCFTLCLKIGLYSIFLLSPFHSISFALYCSLISSPSAHWFHATRKVSL